MRKLTETSVRVAENFEAHFALSTWLPFRSSLDWSDDCQLLSAYTSHDFSQLSVGTSAFLFTELGGSPHQLSLDWNPRLVLWCVLQKSSRICLLKAYRGVFFCSAKSRERYPQVRHARSNNISFTRNDIMPVISEILDMTTLGPSAGRKIHSL